MHQSAINSFITFQKNYLDPKSERIKVVEIGSKSVNANIKNLLNKNTDYRGLDIESGDNVDLVLKDPYKFPIEDSSVDIVISISVFEHTEFFWLTYLEILRILKPSGLFFLNAPSNSKYHRHSTDNWRFYPDSIIALEKWGRQNNYKPKVLEHYTNHENGRDTWNDYISVTIKDENYKDKFTKRILDNKKNYTNGRKDNSENILNFQEFPQDQFNWGWKIYYKWRKFLHKIRNKFN
jgi:SAM-dependent methyltransferase